MTLVRSAIEIAAPPEQVWEVLMDPRRLGDWVTIHRRLRDDAPTRLTRGSRFGQTLSLRGAHLHVEWLVVDLEPPRRAVWEGRGPVHSRAEIVYELTPVPGGTRFDYANEFTTPGGPLGAVAGRVLVGGLSEREATRSLARLKALVERSCTTSG